QSGDCLRGGEGPTGQIAHDPAGVADTSCTVCCAGAVHRMRSDADRRHTCHLIYQPEDISEVIQNNYWRRTRIYSVTVTDAITDMVRDSNSREYRVDEREECADACVPRGRELGAVAAASSAPGAT